MNTKINIDLSILQEILDFPSVVIERYFYNITEQLKQKFYVLNNIDDILYRINHLRIECNNNIDTSEFQNKLNELAEFLNANPTECNQIRQQKIKYGNLLFLNHSIIFIEKENDSNLFHPNCLNRLIIVQNFHFNNDLELVLTKNLFNEQTDITCELLKLECLKSLLITTVRDEIFQLDEFDTDTIEELNLSNRNIINIENSAFEGLSLLKKIQLNNNELVYIDFNLFKDLKNLEEIDLSYNYITYIHEDTFRYLKNLTFVNLSYNTLDRDSIFTLNNERFEVIYHGNPRETNLLITTTE